MAEAIKYQDSGCAIYYTPDAAVSGGEVIQLRDGRAAVLPVDLASGALGAAETTGIWKLTKTASIVLLTGGRVFWDHSANAAHFKKVNDRDFYVGRVAYDAAAADATVQVELNIDPPAHIDMLRDAVLSVPTGTQVVGAFGYPKPFGGAQGIALTATNEAQCIDMLSVDRVALSSNPIADFVLRISANGSTSDVDLNWGLANGTSTTDADAITESVFFHVDGGSTNINAESDDGTTEVAATDTTTDISAGSAVANRVETWIDGRDPSNMKFYVEGVEVLSATANLGNIALATGPLGLLVHLEKVSGTATAGPVYIDRAELRIAQQ